MMRFFGNPHLAIPAIGCLLMVGLEFPPWFLAINFTILFWRYICEEKQLAPPPYWLTNILAGVALMATLGVYKTLLSREAAALFFTCLCSLKILEYRTRRDHYFVILSLMFLIGAKFLFSIDLWIMPFSLYFLYHLWLALIPRKVERGLLPWRQRKYFIRVALFSMPVALILYVLFPRLNTFLIRTNYANGSGQATTGFGGDIRPGSISDLARSDELIFRVEFVQGPYVEPHQLYWRGLTLKNAEGFRWTQGNPLEDKLLEPNLSDIVEYKITMEPSRQRWTFPLDYPVSLSAAGLPILRTRDSTFLATLPYSFRLSMTGKSQLNYHIKPTQLDPYLQLPKLSPGILRLVERIKGSSKSHQEIVQKIKNYFQDQDFRYTLNPGKMDDQNIDDFIFRAKRGFCEHFSSAFGILARAAGVPTRVVIGYQGGQLNKWGGFYSVTSQDAHAWNEFANDKGEWERVDIVDVVAPTRIAYGAAEFLKLPENLQKFTLREGSEDPWWRVAYDFGSTSLDSWNFYWTKWLLDFNLEKQAEYLRFLPLPFGILLLAFVSIIFFVFVGYRFLQYWSDRKNLVEFSYKRLLLWAQKNGFPKDPWEGPSSFLNRLKAVWPERSEDFDTIVTNYIQLTYAEVPLGLDEVSKLAKIIWRIESSTQKIR